jgi:hypothetical protein
VRRSVGGIQIALRLTYATTRRHLQYRLVVASNSRARAGRYDSFRHPEYLGYGGLPLNLEYLIRDLEQRYGPTLDWWALAAAAFSTYHLLTQIRDCWEHGSGSLVPNTAGIMHKLAISAMTYPTS